MEELADAIEDAQYVNAIATQDDGPRPVLAWEEPATNEELENWKSTKLKQQSSQTTTTTASAALSAAASSTTSATNDTNAFTLEWICQQEIGLFLFSSFCKTHNDYIRINFCEEVLRFRNKLNSSSKTARLEKAYEIATQFLSFQQQNRRVVVQEEEEEAPPDEEEGGGTTTTTTKMYKWPIPPRTEINEYDLARRFIKDDHVHTTTTASNFLVSSSSSSKTTTTPVSAATRNNNKKSEKQQQQQKTTTTNTLSSSSKGAAASTKTNSSSSSWSFKMTQQELDKMYTVNSDYPICSECIVGLKGPLLKEIFDCMQEIIEAYPKFQHIARTQSLIVPQLQQRQEAPTNTTTSTASELRRASTGGTKNRSSSFDKEEEEDPLVVALEALSGLDTRDERQKTSAYNFRTNTDKSKKNNRRRRKDDDNDEEEVDDSFEKTEEEEDASNNNNNNTTTAAQQATSTQPTLSRSGAVTTSGPKSQSVIGLTTTTMTTTQETSSSSTTMSSSIRRTGKIVVIAKDLFDKAEHVVFESLKRQYWEDFQKSEQYTKLLNFLWYQDRRVVPDDFFVMRVLGRGGFGLVTACKKGTSGKLYAMKVMNKRRIKMKKSELLAINERQALAAVESKFVINLKYSFHSKDDVYLILDLMTGGDLGYHLHQRGYFSKKECLYFAARIMLGLQALHDEKYVYRDLKPENCLLADDGRVKITDLGLATKITPNLHGAAGTRGYWAPEMLRRDSRGKRMTYDHTVDWFSFGCCVAEFISGQNPFRSEKALNFGLERGKQTKEKAIDCATLEMHPEFPPSRRFEPDAADLCRRLLDKNEKTRLGHNGCEEIMAHPWFKSVNWESIISDRKRPPFTPPKDVNAASQSEIGNFAEDKETVITETDEEIYKDWDWTNPRAFAAEVIEFLIYERVTGEPLLPISQSSSCCCNIL